jgi:muramoyltetrapeptide carboxypeptidase
MSLILRIIYPASCSQPDLVTLPMKHLRDQGHEVRFDPIAADQSWTFTAGSVSDRCQVLMEALQEEDSHGILCARGGYGVSDFLPLMDFQRIQSLPPKVIVGFSDISAIHSAMYSRLSRGGIHGPMPGTDLWKGGDDIVQLLGLLCAFQRGQELKGQISLTPGQGVNGKGQIEGTLFGGCLSVLTNLIGTPYFPKSLSGHIVFIEDTDESPPRIIRYLNQWQQSGALAGVAAIVIGHLRNCAAECLHELYHQIGERYQLPTFYSEQFGHKEANNILQWRGSP